MEKKVYITSLHLQHGGIEMAITLLANALKRRGFDVEILCTYNLGKPAYVLDENVKITYLTEVAPNKKELKEAVKSKSLLRILRQGFYAMKVLYLKKYTMKNKIRNIQSGSIIATRNDHAVILSKYGRNGVKKIAQLHHDHQYEKKLLRDFEKKYMNIDIFVLLTEQLRREISKIMSGNTHTKLVVIPNFLPEFSESDVIQEREKQVVAVGRLHEVKGFLRMLEVWAKTNVDRDVVLKIIGDGEQLQEIQNKMKELNLEKRVVLTGAMEHSKVLAEMKKSLVYLMTSYTEAFPFVLIEAMTSGLPVVAYDVRVGPRAMIQEGVNGYLIEDGNEKKFKEKLEYIITDEKKREEMSANSKDIVRKFSEKVVLKQWIDILNTKI